MPERVAAPFERLSDLQQALRDGETSCAAVVEHYLTVIDRSNERINAFLEVFTDEVRARADALDAKRTAGEPMGRLHGLVIGLKDNICYAGHRVSASSRILEGFESLYSSTAVERLLAEDALIIGRLNCDEFAMGSSNENSAFGAVLNPVDEERVPGGSSGGSAAAVSAGMCMATLGSETGGSVRQPAAFCDIVGVKPTYGRVSRHGLIAFASSFDQIGPMARSVDDVAHILDVIAGADEYDATASQRPVDVLPGDTATDIAGQRIAYFGNLLGHEGMEPVVNDAFAARIEALRAAGAELTAVDFPLQDHIIPTYYVLTTAEASSNLSRYDGMRYGFRSPNAREMTEVYKRSRSEGFGHEVKNRILTGTFVLSAGYYDAYYAKAQKVRRILRDAVRDIFADHDLILTPTSPSVPFKFGERTDDPVQMYLSDMFTALANLAGCPAISLPLDRDETGLPIGTQLMAADFDEKRLFAVGQALMNEN